jgi:nucleoside-diphosphate-sugar epimerase
VENFLQIGKESYRKDQIMHMQGDSTQFFKLFNFNPQYNIYNGLDETIEYYLNIKGK